MAILPISYVSQVGFYVGWGASTVLSTTVNLVMPALSATCVNPAIVFTGDGIDWDGTWTFFDSDGTADTDFSSVFNNAGGSGTHNDLQVYIRTDASKYDGKTVNARYEPALTAYAGNARALWFENVNQTPACDVVMSTAATAGHAPNSIYSAIIGMGIATAYDDQIASFAVWDSDATGVVASTTLDWGSSNSARRVSFYCYDNPSDTASSDYLVIVTPATDGHYNRYAFELFAYEITLSELDGTLVLAGEIDKKLSLTRFLDGTLVLQGAQALLQLFKYIMDATVRMWLAPQSDPIEIDTAPKGFTDIGDDV